MLTHHALHVFVMGAMHAPAQTNNERKRAKRNDLHYPISLHTLSAAWPGKKAAAAQICIVLRRPSVDLAQGELNAVAIAAMFRFSRGRGTNEGRLGCLS